MQVILKFFDNKFNYIISITNVIYFGLLIALYDYKILFSV